MIMIYKLTFNKRAKRRSGTHSFFNQMKALRRFVKFRLIPQSYKLAASGPVFCQGGSQVLHVHQGAVQVVVGVEILLDLQTRAGWIVHLTTLQTIHVSYSVTILCFLLSPQREFISV